MYEEGCAELLLVGDCARQLNGNVRICFESKLNDASNAVNEFAIRRLFV